MARNWGSPLDLYCCLLIRVINGVNDSIDYNHCSTPGHFVPLTATSKPQTVIQCTFHSMAADVLSITPFLSALIAGVLLNA